MSKVKVGFIVEDASDFETVAKLISKMSCAEKIVPKKAVGKGCGKIKIKCQKLSRDLKNKGCEKLVVIRDLDQFDLKKLQIELHKIATPNPFEDFKIIIPVQELEAWLLADTTAIKKCFSQERGEEKDLVDVEKIESPKEYLSKFVKKNYKKIYLNTVHNQKIAELVNIERLRAKCNSFVELESFLEAI